MQFAPKFIVKQKSKNGRWVDAGLGVYSSREAAREAMLECIAKWGGEEFDDYRIVIK